MAQMLAEDLGKTPMSPALQATLLRARDYASNQSHLQVGLEHLLLALTEDEEAASVMTSCKVDLSRLRNDLAGYLGSLGDRAPEGTPSNPTISQPLTEILKYATIAAQQGRRARIDGAIVLAALVGDGRSMAASYLNAQGLTFEQAIRVLQRAPVAAPQAQRPRIASASPASLDREDILAAARERVESRTAGRSERAAPSPVLEPAASPPAAPLSAMPPPGEPRSPASLERDVDRSLSQPQVPGPQPPRDNSPPPSSPHPLHDAAPVDPLPQPPSQLVPAVASYAPPPPTEPDAEAMTQPWPEPDAASTVPPVLPPRAAHRPASSSWAPPPLPVPGTAVRPAPRPQPPSAVAASRAPLQAPPVGADRPRFDQPPPAPWADAAPPLPPDPGADSRPPAGSQGAARPAASPPFALEPGSPTAHAMPGTPVPAGPSGHAPVPPLGPMTPPLDRAPSRQPPAFHQGLPGHGPPSGLPPLVGEAPRVPAIDSAQVSHNVPARLKIGRAMTVEVRVDRTALPGMGAGPRPSAMRNELVSARAIAVRLRSARPNVHIEPVSPETQWDQAAGPAARLAGEAAVWRFTVRPLASGNAELHLLVSARTVGADGVIADTVLPDQVLAARVGRDVARTAQRGLSVAGIAFGAIVVERLGELVFRVDVVTALRKLIGL